MQPKILVVDDEKAIRFAVQEYLTGCGYEVDAARDQNEAEALLTRHAYSVLISDLRLTGSDDTQGLDIAASALNRQPALRCILLTAYGTPDIERRAYGQGVHLCMSKPKPLDEVAAAVSQMLGAPTSASSAL